MLAELLQNVQRVALNAHSQTAYSSTPAALLTACESANLSKNAILDADGRPLGNLGPEIPGLQRQGAEVIAVWSNVAIQEI